ncbi:unnamed protein product [Somion occarium]|uniref:Rgp1-domain-containing protein n=1 Tax=Somion occarium TaxID=3059160 RepID=A0ABP1CQ39_9APHY
MPASTSETFIDEPIRVHVQPSQPSYFAGEPFSVHITITNTRTPESLPPRSASHTSTSFHVQGQHKRGAHSISSVPLARPPTSPGIRTALPYTAVFSGKQEKNGSGNVRRGLIGIGSAGNGDARTKASKSLDDVRIEGSTSQGPRRPPITKSLSVSITPDELSSQLQVQEDVKGKSPLRPLRAQDGSYSTPTSPRISSPLARSASVPLNHPHARKQSLLDGQLQLQDLRPPPTLSPFNPAPTPSASTSTFSLSLDPIAESNGSLFPPKTPSFPSPIPETSAADFRTQLPKIPQVPSVTITGATPKKGEAGHSYPPRPPNHHGPPRRPAHLGLGHGPPPNASAQNGPKTSFSSTFRPANTELILYSYAQLVGTLSITPLPGSSPTPEQTRTLHAVRTNLLKKQAIGGGSMDLTSAGGLSPPGTTRPSAVRRVSHGRSASLSTGILSLLSPSSSAPAVSSSSQGWTPGHRARTPSMFAGFFSSSSSSSVDIIGDGGTGLGLGLSVDEELIDPDVPLPTFEVQPSMLAVDLSLGPGESRSYEYTINLPENLPPTFRGRALKFSYQFILGICRAASSPSSSTPSSASGNSRSRVMKVPIRVYNHVMVGRPPSPYDMLWPVESRKQRHLQPLAKVIEHNPANSQRPPTMSSPNGKPPESNTTGTSYQDLQAYARTLLASATPSSPPIAASDTMGPVDQNIGPSSSSTRYSIAPVSLSATKEARTRDSDLDVLSAAGIVRLGEGETRDEESVSGCREAVEILTRNPKKLSYDVNKDGVKVAVLTFTKSAYRLGEPVFGVVELNERTSRARVLKLSALLEAHESLPGCISPSNNSRHLRRVHAEQHSSFMASMLRTTFSLDIPPDGSPAFQVDVQGSSNFPASRTSPGGLEWKVRLCLLVSVGSPTSRTDANGVRLKNLVRDGPRGEWGSSWKASDSIAPMERPDTRVHANGNEELLPTSPSTAKSWMSFFTTSLLGVSEIGYHDGDEDIDDEGATEDGEKDADEIGSEEEWRELKVEMVECEVPIKVWPGNTAFKATEVVFDV